MSTARLGPLSIVADARIDDQANLRGMLGLSDGRPRQSAELIADCWRRWGEASLERLVGDFAFALFDSSNNRLFLARDVMGRRPLHYRAVDGGLAIATLPSALALDDGRQDVDIDTLLRYHAMFPQTGNDSFFVGIRRVEPGTLVTWQQGSLTVRPYWLPPHATLSIGANEAVEEVRRLLALAVADRAEPGVPIALQLSGGMDSSAVAAAVGEAGLDAIAVTGIATDRADPPPPGYEPEDGRVAALTVARFSTMRHVLCAPPLRLWTTLLDDWNSVVDQPVRSLENIDWVDGTARAAAAQGAATLLSGDFGNNSLSYDGTALFADHLRHGRWLALAGESRAFRKVTGARRRGVASYAVGPFIPSPLWRLISHLPAPQRGLTDLAMLKPGHPAIRRLIERARADHHDLSAHPPASSWQARAGELRWVDNSLLGKAISARCGVITTDPTADRRLLEFTLSLPAEHWLSQGQTRALARRLLAGRVPDEVVNPAGRGFQGADWRASVEPALGGLRDEVVRLRQTEFGDLLDLDRMERMLAEWPRNGWSDNRQQIRYRFSLLHAIGAGHYQRTRSSCAASLA